MNTDQLFLSTPTALSLYEKYAKNAPVYDYHCHLSAKDIFEDKVFDNISYLWLAHDHYKWRAMRVAGLDEYYITGGASPLEKFQAFAKVCSRLVGSPLYLWSHLELKNYFGIVDTLNEKNSAEIFNRCNASITAQQMRPSALIAKANVKLICTTDDPTDTLEWHEKIGEQKRPDLKVLPTFRPDRALNIQLDGFTDYVKLLGASCQKPITCYADLLACLAQRIDYFVAAGCVITDHAIERLQLFETTADEVAALFGRRLTGHQLSAEQISAYRSFTLQQLAAIYKKRNLVMQLHLGAMRNLNTSRFEQLGPDSGYDIMTDENLAEPLAALLNNLQKTGNLPSTILYSLNSKDNHVLSCLPPCFHNGKTAGFVMFGVAWWLNDHHDGILDYFKATAAQGLLPYVVGMLTDSRSFLSYTRHDYFRRLLCQYIGEQVEAGEFDDDPEILKELVEGICYKNIKQYLMIPWQSFCLKHMVNATSELEQIRKAAETSGETGIYAASINRCQGSLLFILKQKTDKKLVVFGPGEAYADFEGDEQNIDGIPFKVCSLNHHNCVIIRREFAFTRPTAVIKCQKTMGLGDRLGLATAGHIKLIEQYDIKPVLAQQSMRELSLTSRTYDDVLDDASWAVFQEDYQGGFGADGDHLKKAEDIETALLCGFTMITLDCSENIDNRISTLSDTAVEKLYTSSQTNEHEALRRKYTDKIIPISDGTIISFGQIDLKRIILTYGAAVDFAIRIYQTQIKNYGREVDFEISIDETTTATSLQAHFFFASELFSAGVLAATIAPRFCGEFQKGIDYIGSIEDFEREFKGHAAIANHFGYKLSIHSGSDKFAVFPIIGRETQGHYHLKTAGTNWLEAVRVIATQAPVLYREIHKFALENLDEAKSYYHIGADVNNIADIESLHDSKLPALLDKPDSRQVLHITYGLILSAKESDGKARFKDRIEAVLHEFEEEYSQALIQHIGRHLHDLGELPCCT